MGRRPGNAGTAAAVAQLVPFQLVSPKNACPRPWTERNLYPDRSPFGDRFGFVRPLLNFRVVRAKHLAQIVGTALVERRRSKLPIAGVEEKERFFVAPLLRMTTLG